MACDERGCDVGNKYELVPPDGGWAYMIGIAMILNLMAVSGFVSSIGMIFSDFFTELEMGSVEVQLLHGINSMGVALSSFFTGPLTKVMSTRKLAFLASAFLNAGVFGTVFVRSRAKLFICHGILQSIGVGMLYNVTCTSVNDYFLRKRFLITSVAQTVVAAGGMAVPLAVNWTRTTYGFRSTLFMMSAVSLQTFIGSSLMQPVKWHLKKVPFTRETIELLRVKKQKNKRHPVVQRMDQTNGSPETVNSDTMDVALKQNVILDFVKNGLDWRFLKKFLLSCTCLGMPLSLASDVMFTLFLPQYLYSRDWQKEDVAWVLTLLSVGDITTRVFLIFASKWLAKVSNHLIYVTGMAIDVVSKLILLTTSNNTIARITLTLTGFSRCIIMVVFPLVVSDAAPPENYATGFGVCILLYGVIGITLGPAIGAVRDVTGQYTTMFHLLNGIMAAVTVAWSFELYHKRKNTRIHLDLRARAQAVDVEE